MDDLFIYDGDGSTPTTNWDWISPSLGQSAGLPDNRAMRMKHIFNELGCASATEYSVPWERSGGSDLDQFDQIAVYEGYRQISYLTPSSFLLLSNEIRSSIFNEYRQRETIFLTPKLFPSNPGDGIGGQVTRHSGYRPREDFVGVQPSNKVLASDGTRYYSNQLGILDFDASPAAQYFSSFGDSGPIYDKSAAFGRRFTGNTDENINVKLSARHDERINVLYWDGHVGGMTMQEAWKDPTPWYPGRTIFNGDGVTPESKAFFPSGKIIH